MPGERKEAVMALVEKAQQLVESISFDMNGDLIGGKWIGGHGGLISHDTMIKADEVRRVLAAYKQGND